MKDQSKTKQVLIQELASLKQRISELEQSEAGHKLHEIEECYRSLFENSMDAILLTIPDGRIIDANPAACRMFGRTREEIIAVGRSGVVDTTDPRLPILLEERARTGKFSGELIHLRKDGTRFPAELTTSVFIDHDGNAKTSMIIRDVTEQKRAEEALRERDILFKKLSFHVPGMIYQFMRRPDGTYCVPFTTEAIKDIFGCSPQDVREDFSPITKAILPEDLDKVVGSIESSAESMTVWQCEYRVQIPGQQIRWMFGLSTPEKLADGSILWHGFNTDITDRKQAEEALKKSEEQYRLLSENSPSMIFLLDTEGNVLLVNQKSAAMFGVKSDAIIGRNIRDLFPERIAERHKQAIDQVVRDGKTFYSELSEQFPVGERWIDAHIVPVLDKENSKIIAVLGISHDITERKQAEEALHASLREKEILLGEIHHRVKNNLQVISGLLDLQARSSGNPELIERLNESQSRIRSMTMVHEKLYGSKDFARINLAGYVRTLSRELLQSYKINPGKIDLIVKTEGDVYVDIIHSALSNCA